MKTCFANLIISYTGDLFMLILHFAVTFCALPWELYVKILFVADQGKFFGNWPLVRPYLFCSSRSPFVEFDETFSKEIQDKSITFSTKKTFYNCFSLLVTTIYDHLWNTAFAAKIRLDLRGLFHKTNEWIFNRIRVRTSANKSRITIGQLRAIIDYHSISF